MSRWQSEQLTMWVGPTRTVFFRQEEGHSELFTHIPWSATDKLSDNIERCLQKLPPTGCELQIILDDSLARFWRVDPPQNIGRLDDLRDVTRIRFETLYDLPVSDWMIDADWNATEPFLACAVPTALTLALSQRLNEPDCRHIRIVGYDPAFIYYWNDQHRNLANDAEGFAVVGTCTLTVTLIRNSKIMGVRCLSLPNMHAKSFQALDDTIQNLGLQLDLKTPKKIWLTGNLSDRWKPFNTSRIKWRRLAARPPAQAATRSQADTSA